MEFFIVDTEIVLRLVRISNRNVLMLAATALEHPARLDQNDIQVQELAVPVRVERSSMNITSMHNIHAGRPAAILGGGPSLPADIKKIPSSAATFGCNDHALHIGILPWYLVINDDPACKPHLLQAMLEFKGKVIKPNDIKAEPANKPRQLQAVRQFKGTVISPNIQHTDIDLSGVDYWHDLTSMTACWIAEYMGCAPIYLCGMDLYQGAAKYCHDKDDGIAKAIYDRTLEQHLAHWRKAFTHLQHPEQLIAVSGPLVELFAGKA
jgi:hypothetical protein